MTPDNEVTICVLVTIGCGFLAYVDVVGLAMAGMVIKDQNEIGAAIGMTATVRTGISTVGTAIYTTVLSNRLTNNISSLVPAALIKAGLPNSSVAAWLKAFAAGSPTALGSVKGNNPAITAAGQHAYQVAQSQAYRTVFLSTIAFSGIAVILSFFTPSADAVMTSNVATTLHKRNETEVVAGKGTESHSQV